MENNLYIHLSQLADIRDSRTYANCFYQNTDIANCLRKIGELMNSTLERIVT